MAELGNAGVLIFVDCFRSLGRGVPESDDAEAVFLYSGWDNFDEQEAVKDHKLCSGMKGKMLKYVQWIN